MSGVATAIGIGAAVSLYQAEQARQAQSDADERIKQEKIAAGIEKDWQQKKKGIADKNASQAALRLRGGTEASPVVGGTSSNIASPVVGTGTQQPLMGLLGLLGTITGQPQQAGIPGITLPPNQKTNSPLGL